MKRFLSVCKTDVHCSSNLRQRVWQGFVGCRYAKRFFLVFDVRYIYIDMSFNITSNIVFDITPFLNRKNPVFLYNGTVDMHLFFCILTYDVVFNIRT